MFRMPTAATLSLFVAASLALLSESTCGQTILSKRSAAIDVAVRFTAAHSGAVTGQLVGKLMHNGRPASHQTVRLIAKQAPSGSTAITRTDDEGEFSFAIARGGVYSLRTAGQTKVCRIWNAKQAPPSAVDQVLFASDIAIVRGQSCDCGVPMCNGGCKNTLGSFKNCDTCCGEPPRLSNCECCGDYWGGCECGGCLTGRNKGLMLMLGGALIVFALDDDDGPVEADLGEANAVGTAATPTEREDMTDDDMTGDDGAAAAASTADTRVAS